MRIMICSDAPWTNGSMGIQTNLLLDNFIKLGHDVACQVEYGLDGGKIQIGEMVFYPKAGTVVGNLLPLYVEDFQADLVLFMMDQWSFIDSYGNPQFLESLPCPAGMWLMTEGVPAPPIVVALGRRVTYPLVFSQFCKETLRESRVFCDYMPFILDTETFYSKDKTLIRQSRGLPEDDFVVTMIGANSGIPGRKAFAENMRAFKRFHDQHPKSRLILISSVLPNRKSGYNLNDLIRSIGIPESALNIVDQGMYHAGFTNPVYIRDILNASDVLLHASAAESLGLVVLEAQACGTPVITTNFSGMVETTVNGIKTDPIQMSWVPGPYWQAVPNIDAIYNALVEIYSWDEDTRRSKAEIGIEFVDKNYSWEVVSKRYYMPFLEKVEILRS